MRKCEYCEGGGFSEEKSPPSRSLPKRFTMGRFWGRGRFSERSASPLDPLSRRAAGVWLGDFCIVGSAGALGAVSCGLVESTAADRAAADVRRLGTNPSARLRRAPPLSGEALRGMPPKGFLCGGRAYLSPSAAADGLPPSAERDKGWRQCRHKLLFRARWARPKGFPIALWKPSAPHL